MTAATTIVTANATAAAAAGSPPGFASSRGQSRSVAFVAGTGDPAGTGVLATSPASAVTVQDLLHRRADLPAGHPDRAALRARGIEAGLPLARRVAARYRGRGEPLDDLYRVAAVALAKAVAVTCRVLNVSRSGY